MECPICKNTMGFAFGVCCECGFNHISNEFHWIKINTDILKAILSEDEDLFEKLVYEHQKMKSR